jgi:hypothetical protein
MGVLSETNPAEHPLVAVGQAISVIKGDKQTIVDRFILNILEVM